MFIGAEHCILRVLLHKNSGNIPILYFDIFPECIESLSAPTGFIPFFRLNKLWCVHRWDW